MCFRLAKAWGTGHKKGRGRKQGITQGCSPGWCAAGAWDRLKKGDVTKS